MELGGSSQPGPLAGAGPPCSLQAEDMARKGGQLEQGPTLGVGAMPLQVATGAEGVPGVPGDGPAWASSLLLNRQLGEEQWLQISKELADLEVATHSLREQHEAEVFQLRSEVLRLESRVLELELYGNRPSQGCAAPVTAQGPGPANHHQVQMLPQDGPEKQQEKPGDGLQGVPPPPSSQLQGDAKQALECHQAQQQALEARVAALGQELQHVREEARAAREQLATQTMALSASQGQLHQAEVENSQLQLQLKRLSQQYAVRLQCQIQEVMKHATGADGTESNTAALCGFLESTLQDIQAAHRSREQQLARAAHAYHKRLADLSRRHEELLATRRWLQGLAEPSSPPTNHTKQLLGCQQAFQGHTTSYSGADAAVWAQIWRKLQATSHGSQAELERERAQLLARATVAEGQLTQLQEYVDQHLGRYKQEILRLRKLVGVGDPYKVGSHTPAKLQ